MIPQQQPAAIASSCTVVEDLQLRPPADTAVRRTAASWAELRAASLYVFRRWSMKHARCIIYRPEKLAVRDKQHKQQSVHDQQQLIASTGALVAPFFGLRRARHETRAQARLLPRLAVAKTYHWSTLPYHREWDG